jgi:glycine betaine/proline transport system ATP-binding protein
MNEPVQQGDPVVSCRNVWKIFGPNPRRVAADLAAGRARGEISAAAVLPPGHIAAVRDISFDVYPGETFVVMGLSGSGKSTLLRCLPRLIEPTLGEVWVDGVEISQADKRQLRELRRHKLSMVFQHFGLFPHRRVIDNVAFGLEIQGVGRKDRYTAARAMIAQVGLDGWENHYPGQLSGGMQQRVGLARALAVNPSILLFDEPFSALDPLIRREMQDELLRLEAAHGKTMIFITHDFAEAIKLGNRIAIMREGRFVQVGTAEQVVLNPADEYVAEFIKDVPKAKVLTAGAIMRPVNGAPVGSRQIPSSTKLDAMIPIFAATDQTLPVVDDANRLVGCVDREDVMWALSPAGERPAPGLQGLPA